MTKIKILISAFVLFFTSFANANSIDSVFLKMPSKFIPLLTQTARFEMLEYSKAAQTDSVKNSLGGFSQIIYRDTLQKHLMLKIASNTTLEIKLFANTDSTYMVGVIRTVNNSVPNSTLAFYDANWTLLPLSLPTVTSAEWLHNWAKNKLMGENKQIEKLLSDNYLVLNFSKSENLIEMQNYSAKLLSVEDNQRLLAFTSNTHPEETKILFRILSNLPNPVIEMLK